MGMEQFRQEQQITHPMTFDELSMECSMSFIKALQELKNLRPQLYSAAEYCEKSYLHSDQKQMVLDNLKDYAVRAVVNAVDHLGTVAYKLGDLLEQQTSDVATMELKVTCMNQQLLTCRTYTDNEGLRQQQLLSVIPRHHKHYILPNSLNKKVHFSPHVKTDARQSNLHQRSRPLSGVPAAKTLSWHLASATKSTLKAPPRSLRSEDPKAYGKTSEAFQFSDAEDGVQKKSLAADLHMSGGGHVPMQTFGAARRDMSGGSKPLSSRPEVVPAAVRSKSVLSSLFIKHKARKLKLAS